MKPDSSSSAMHGNLGARGYGLVLDRRFGPFFFGKVLSSVGIWIHSIVAAVVVFEVSQSAFIVGLVGAVQFAPQLLFAPLCGRMADRGNPALQIVIGRILTGLGSGGIAVGIWLVGDVTALPGPAPVLVSSLIVGIGLVVGGPAMQSIVPSLIRPGEMAAAMALNTVPMTLARAGGPAIGAFIATRFGPEIAFAIAALLNVAYGLTILALGLAPAKPDPSHIDFTIRAAIRHLRADRRLCVLLVGVAGVGFGSDPSLTLAPAIADELAGGTHLVGALASSFGVGAAIGFLMFAPLHSRYGLPQLTSGGLALMAGGLVGAIADVPAAALLSFGVSGVGMTLALTSVSTQIHLRSPDILRGRIMALWFVAFLGTRPLAAGLDGYLADAVSVDIALLATAVIVALAAGVSRPSRFSTESS